MHELSIVAALIELCEEQAQQQNAAQISEIYTKIGRLSGIDKAQFARCFESFKQGGICQHARLFMEDEPLFGECSCGFSGEIKSNDLHCPKCQGSELKLSAGEDFYLMRLVMS